jgi:PqqD family protein of HPr-rel-A system
MRWAVNSSVVWSETGDEIRLYDTVSGDFHTLSPTGSAIWRRISDTGDQDAIVAALAAEFGAQDDNQRHLIASDTERFLRGLADRGLIVEPSRDAELPR